MIKSRRKRWTELVTLMRYHKSLHTSGRKTRREITTWGKSTVVCENNIEIDLLEMCEDVEWIHLARLRFQWLAVVSTAINLRVP